MIIILGNQHFHFRYYWEVTEPSENNQFCMAILSPLFRIPGFGEHFFIKFVMITNAGTFQNNFTERIQLNTSVKIKFQRKTQWNCTLKKKTLKLQDIIKLPHSAPFSIHMFSVCLSCVVTLCVWFCAALQITVFRMGSEGQHDIEMSILTALLKGGFARHSGRMHNSIPGGHSLFMSKSLISSFGF